MSDHEEHQSGANAPVTAHYEELNVFGSVTGKTVRGERTERPDSNCAILAHRRGCHLTPEGNSRED
jgi:hypothetical protein